ncbi:LysR family transcriptional regulator [Acidocella sp. KAb 2-4]|uniref:LysR substrate-binding domain-containing protein n=1 Tax=Acidocella sp. KAb 2-4 TaxID=2885158 RepID=UPI001D077565|nr:LysR family transcriptional regulator [Acidocella sp. KAb 2-4]MCB5943859.1 LysR family transcriptional regulator [Acidocella sp. KAb 2-4]
MNQTLDWDLLQSFLAVARTGRLTGAARRLGIDHSTLSRRLTALEAALGTKLFERQLSGYRLTRQGEHLLGQAETMESTVLAIQSDAGRERAQVSGLVRIGVPDGFGTFFLAPEIGRLAAAQPNLQIDLAATPRGFSLSKRDADIAIMLSRPAHGRIHARKLTDYELGLYAAADLAPLVRSAEDIARLPFISYIDDMLFAPELDYVPAIGKGIEPKLRCSNLIAQHMAAAAGAGLCILPCFLADGDARLTRVLRQEIRLIRSFWMLVPSDIRELARIRVTCDFIADAVARAAPRFLPEKG